jgi:hypothetical protein
MAKKRQDDIDTDPGYRGFEPDPPPAELETAPADVVPESSPESKPPEEKKDEPPARALDRVTLEVYCSASGLKWDQIAGFKSWAKRQKLARLTMPEWKAKHDEFVVRPVR